MKGPVSVYWKIIRSL